MQQIIPSNLSMLCFRTYVILCWDEIKWHIVLLWCWWAKKEGWSLCPPKTRWNVSTCFCSFYSPDKIETTGSLGSPKEENCILTSDLLILSIIPAPGFKILVNGMVLLMFPIVVSCPQRCILFKQEICPFSTEINTTGDEPPTGSFLMKPLKPWLSWHMDQGRQT